MTNVSLQVPIIGVHHSPLVQKFGAPRQPNLVNVASTIEFFAPYHHPQAFVELENFSHIWVLWHFHQNKAQASFVPQVRPPRFGGNKKMGVFATRSMYRPTALGMSVVQLSGIEYSEQGVRLHIIGADMIDGTPIVDIKPYLPYSDAIDGARCMNISAPCQKNVLLSLQAQMDFEAIKTACALSDEDLHIIKNLVAQDPRPAYKHDDTSVFAMRYQQVDVKFSLIADNVFEIAAIERIAC